MKAWIAKDQDGQIFMYLSKPVKCGFDDDNPELNPEIWYSNGKGSLCIEADILPGNINPQWEDEEPIEVELTIRKI